MSSKLAMGNDFMQQLRGAMHEVAKRVIDFGHRMEARRMMMDESFSKLTKILGSKASVMYGAVIKSCEAMAATVEPIMAASPSRPAFARVPVGPNHGPVVR